MRTMTTLNAAAAGAMVEAGVAAATDVTGFGLLGHLRKMLEASGASARVDATAVPMLPGALDLAQRGVVSGGTGRNHAWLNPTTEWGALTQPEQLVLADAQTSGGLLIATRHARWAPGGAGGARGRVTPRSARWSPGSPAASRSTAGSPPRRRPRAPASARSGSGITNPLIGFAPATGGADAPRDRRAHEADDANWTASSSRRSWSRVSASSRTNAVASSRRTATGRPVKVFTMKNADASPVTLSARRQGAAAGVRRDG